jgi:hypothetical protein
MSDDQIIALLAVIRDLQKQNVENYKIALQKQAEALEFQKQRASEFRSIATRQKKMIILAVIITPIVFFIVASMPQAFKYLLTGR